MRDVARADALVVVGLDLEVGWVPALLQSARNNDVMVGARGYIDCSRVIQAMDLPTGDLDRSMGDVHPHGNPHYLVSPLQAFPVITFITERLAALDSAGAEHYRSRAAAYAERLATALYGEALVQQHSVEQITQWHLAGVLFDHIDEAQVGGWLAELAPLRGVAFVGDHKQWTYLAACFGFEMLAHMEPKAGVPPTTSHLKRVIAKVQAADRVGGVLTAPWFDQRHARTVAQATGIPVLRLAHQVRAMPNSETFMSFSASNVAALTQVAKALAVTTE